MPASTIGLYFSKWGNDFSIPSKPSLNPIYLFRWAQWFKSNPRSSDYMRRLFAERFPEGEFIDTNEIGVAKLVKHIVEGDEIVFLYPDAIGLGFSDIEKQVSRACSPSVCVRVLNGRGREFIFNRNTKYNLHLRRFLEQTMLTEIIACLLITVCTPFLLLIDFLRGKNDS